MNTTNSQTERSLHLLIWIAGIVVILFSAVGIAAIMGWIPMSMGRFTNNTETSSPGKLAANEAQPAARAAQRPIQNFKG